MELPKALTAALTGADEEYLIGLCNKGTVNRAKKDLAAGISPEIQVEGEAVTLNLGEVSCQIRSPLGESTCSCPSSGICRHRILAMLWLKEQCAAAAPAEDTETAVEPETPPAPPSFASLRDYPTEKLVKQLGGKRLAAALFHWQSGSGPEITETSVVTVPMPWLPATVRLLEPLEHSTCSCHSKTLCLHKAEALLYWQLLHQIAKPEALQQVQPAGEALDPEEVQGVCQAVRQTLAAQLSAGLSRMPTTVCETVERMASLCHTARLPELERSLRSLHGAYSAYFSRSATYRDTELLRRFSHSFRLAAALETADEAGCRALAGTFREEYHNTTLLRLYLLGNREFFGRSGYAGTIYYFWERTSKRWLTFTHVRPTFYSDSGRGRHFGAAVPWGLPVPLWSLQGQGMDLTGAKMTQAGSLSSTESCQAELLGKQHWEDILPQEIICSHFDTLLEHTRPGAPEEERLCLLQPSLIQPQPYDQVRQTFSIRLLDSDGRDVWAELRYQKELNRQMDWMKRLTERLENHRGVPPLFFGQLYRDGDKLKLLPIAVFGKGGFL